MDQKFYTLQTLARGYVEGQQSKKKISEFARILRQEGHKVQANVEKFLVDQGRVVTDFFEFQGHEFEATATGENSKKGGGEKEIVERPSK